jgi:tRNA (mo5U34)-methyltransferase
VAREIRALGPWSHNLQLPGGACTAPDHPLGDYPRVEWQALAPHLPADLHGWRALDVGCAAGFYSFALAERGCDVLGIDGDAHRLQQARWANGQLGLTHRVHLEQREVYELALLAGRFDLVLFLGVFHRLRHPLLGLEMAADKAQRLLVFQSPQMPGTRVATETGGRGVAGRDALLRRGWPKMAFVEHDFDGDPGSWWVPNHACVEALLRGVGFGVQARPAPDLYVCAPLPGPRPQLSYRQLVGWLRDERWRASLQRSDRGLA